MNEAEWLACVDAVELLKHLREGATSRKLRLFACGCCRMVWDKLAKRTGRAAVEVAERFADGKARREQLSTAWNRTRSYCCESLASSILEPYPIHYFINGECTNFDVKDGLPLVRDVFGGPFRPCAVDSRWLEWDGGTVRNMARSIYDERAFDRLPVLADALEDAGCAEEEMLAHLRGGGPHVRGCWAVDLLLGLE